MSNPQLILASASPRRLELLQQIGLQPLVVPADIDETEELNESAQDFVTRMAIEKAAVVAALHEHAVVIGSDTSIDLDGEIIGKPENFDDAMTILKKLSARSHLVHTGVALQMGNKAASTVVTSEVSFRSLSDSEIANYWHSGEPQGKAGAYAIQGIGSVFIEKITGSYSAIMGLPLFETAAMLTNFGIPVLQHGSAINE